MRHFDLGGTFSSILIPGNSLLHLLTNEELKECFGCVRRPLEPSGRLIFDISKWDMSRYARDPTHRYHAFTQDEITIEETTSYDAAAKPDTGSSRVSRLSRRALARCVSARSRC
jgi:hypothetical protein